MTKEQENAINELQRMKMDKSHTGSEYNAIKTAIQAIKDLDRNIYIVIAANEYELARNADCFDVNAGKYVRFSNYEEYRNFIIKSRALKEKRIEKQVEWREKQRIKELKKYAKVKAMQDKRLAEYSEKYKDKEPPKYGWELREIEDMIKDFFRKTRFISEKDVEG